MNALHGHDLPDNEQHSNSDEHRNTADMIKEMTPSILECKQESDETHIPQETIRHLQAPELVSVPPTPEFVTPEQTLHSTNMDMCKLCHDKNNMTDIKWNDRF